MKFYFLTRYIAGLCLLLLLSSCLTIKPPEYKKTENMLTHQSGDEFIMTFDLSLHNPNNWSLRLSEAEAVVTLDSIPLGNAHLINQVRFTRNSDFKIPMMAKSTRLDLSKLSSLGLGMLFGKQTSTVTIKGKMVLKKFIFRKKFEYEYQEKIDGKFLESLF